MTKLEHALSLAAAGFWIFPCLPNCKRPAIKGWQAAATRDSETITTWFRDNKLNPAIFTGKFGYDQALVVVDVDTKNGKHGYASLDALWVAGHDLPNTRNVRTPSGGVHLYYSVPRAVRQGTDILGDGLDIRSRGGYVLGPGSQIDGGLYTISLDNPIPPAPGWLLGRCGYTLRHASQLPDRVLTELDKALVYDRARSFVSQDIHLAVSGRGGNHQAYKVACKLKDYGMSEDEALLFLLEPGGWNDRCSPPWHPDELWAIVRNAYRYGTKGIGEDAPEAVFKRVPRKDTAADYVARIIPPLLWVIPDLIPEGLTIVAGPAKVGKSWLALGLVCASADGGHAFGSIKCDQVETLYLALEDGEGRIQRRLNKLGEASLDAFIKTDWPRMDAGGFEALVKWIDENPKCRLIFIDTLKRFRPKAARGASPYDIDSDALQPLHQFAKDRHIAIVVLHHTRKLRSEDDWQDDITGSTGLTGMSDNNMVLTRTRNQKVSKLNVTGRDVLEQTVMLELNDGRWRVKAEGEATSDATPVQRLVLDAIEAAGEAGAGPTEIGQKIGRSAAQTSDYIHALANKGLLRSPQIGKWALVRSGVDHFDPGAT
jgi:hypothetical protein